MKKKMLFKIKNTTKLKWKHILKFKKNDKYYISVIEKADAQNGNHWSRKDFKNIFKNNTDVKDK